MEAPSSAVNNPTRASRCRATTASSTARWPRRSANHPTTGTPRASPTAAAALAEPPTATEPLVEVTRARIASGTIVIGSRPSAVVGR